MPEQYKMVAENPQSTVVSDFEPVYRKSTQYQSEAEMEHDFISQLEKQGYEYLPGCGYQGSVQPNQPLQPRKFLGRQRTV